MEYYRKTAGNTARITHADGFTRRPSGVQHDDGRIHFSFLIKEIPRG